MSKCDFNKVTWVFSCKFATYFQNTFAYEHIWKAASVFGALSNICDVDFLWKYLMGKSS